MNVYARYRDYQAKTAQGLAAAMWGIWLNRVFPGQRAVILGLLAARADEVILASKAELEASHGA